MSTFTIEDAFYITNRGWVLAGNLLGEVTSGNRLAAERELLILSVEAINVQGKHKTGLVIAQQFESRDELVEKHLIGATAPIIV